MSLNVLFRKIKIPMLVSMRHDVVLSNPHSGCVTQTARAFKNQLFDTKPFVMHANLALSFRFYAKRAGRQLLQVSSVYWNETFRALKRPATVPAPSKQSVALSSVAAGAFGVTDRNTGSIVIPRVVATVILTSQR